MADQVVDLRTETRSLINQTDESNSQITSPQILIWLNEAYRAFVAELAAIPETGYDLTAATGDISLNSNILTLLSAHICRVGSSDYEEMAIIGMDKLNSVNPGYLSADAGIPSYFVRKSTFTAWLYPQPDTANVGQTIKIRTIAFPTELSSDSDTPDLPKNLIDLMPYWAAYRAFSQMGMSEKATEKLIFVRTQLKAQKQISTKFSGQSNSFMWGNRED